MVAIGREANARFLTATNSFEIMMATATGNLKQQKTNVVRSEVHPDSLLIGMNGARKRYFLIIVGQYMRTACGKQPWVERSLLAPHPSASRHSK